MAEDNEATLGISTTQVRRLAEMVSHRIVKETLVACAERIEELTTMNRILNSLGSLPAKHDPDDLQAISNRLADIERQLPNLSSIDQLVREAMERLGYRQRI